MGATETEAGDCDGRVTTSLEDLKNGEASSNTATRHYPVDLPNLPFARYEHRCLTARDILVNRIMAQVMSPAAVPANATWLTASSPEPRGLPAIKHKNPTLYADLQLLHKMLYTTSAKEPDAQMDDMLLYCQDGLESIDGSYSAEFLEARALFRKLVKTRFLTPMVTVEEVALDLVERHYLEQDDPALRLWLQARRPPMPTPSNASPETTQAHHRATKPDSRARLVKEYDGFHDASRKSDHKRWLNEDTLLLRSLQTSARSVQANFLFDGGAFLPVLRQPLFSDALARYAHQLYSLRVIGLIIAPTWPEKGISLRQMLIPVGPRKRRHSSKKPWLMYDLVLGRTYRGLDRDGIWSIRRSSGGIRAGRLGQTSRGRATSEPPPQTFAAARLPGLANNVQEDLIFPKMSLATLDRRSRRRSLSRTRIAEMFDWNTANNNPSSSTATPSGEPSRLATRRWFGSLEEEPTGREVPVNQGVELAIALDPERLGVYTQSPADRALDSSQPLQSSHSFDENLIDSTAQSNQHILDQPADSGQTPAALSCANCLDKTHVTSSCHLPCGYCGASNPDRMWHNAVQDLDPGPVAGQHREPHLAPQCPVAASNRCKCTPFPMYHVAAKCPVVCSRACGNEHPRGSFKHRSAMGCRSRCCMCGIKGHSGSQCKLKKCRCGGHHLGQDCGWNPQCRVPGCTRYLCGMHCADCGGEKGAGGLVGGRCKTCLQSSGQDTTSRGTSTVDAAVDNGKRKRARKRKEKPKDEQELKRDSGVTAHEVEEPSWLPLRPRSDAKTKT